MNKVVVKTSLQQADEADTQYWIKASPLIKIAALTQIRRQFYQLTRKKFPTCIEKIVYKKPL